MTSCKFFDPIAPETCGLGGACEHHETVVVTRHAGLVEYLREIGLVQAGTLILAHARPEDVKGKHVIGVLPLALAALAAAVTEVPLALTPDMRGRELTLDEVRACAGEPVTYRVIR